MKNHFSPLAVLFVLFFIWNANAQTPPIPMPTPPPAVIPMPIPKTDDEWTGELKTAVDALNEYDSTKFKNLIAQKPQLTKAKNAKGNTILHVAARNSSKTEVVRLLLEKGANVNAANNNGETPVSVATYIGAKENFQLLMASKPNLLVKTISGETLLHLAARGGNAEIAQILLDTKTLDLNARNESGDTPVLLAASGYFAREVLEVFLKAGANPNQKDKNNATPLHIAADSRNDETVALLIKYKADINARANGGNTPLINAVEEVKSVAALVEAGADVNAKNNGGTTALHRACAEIEPESVRYLVTHKAAVNAKNNEGETPLEIALDNNFGDASKITEIIEFLIENNAPTDWQGEDGATILHQAAANNNASLIELLIKKGAKTEAATADGKTALMTAAAENNADAVDALLESGANPNARDEDGNSALHIAAENDFSLVAKLLFAKKADINIANKIGESPLHIAAENNKFRLAALLLKNNANANAKDEDENTPLHDAAGNGSIRIVKLLLANKADATLANKTGLTARQIAESADFAEIVALLPEPPKEN